MTSYRVVLREAEKPSLREKAVRVEILLHDVDKIIRPNMLDHMYRFLDANDRTLLEIAQSDVYLIQGVEMGDPFD